VHTVVTQLPVATGAKVTAAVSLPGSGWVTMLLGQVMVGGAVLPTTVMVKLPLTELLDVSVALQLTVFVPMGKALPEGGVHTVVSAQLPVATGANLTVAVHLPGSGCVTMLLGQVIFGGAGGVSTPKTSAVSVPLPVSSSAVLDWKVVEKSAWATAPV
jgi:hypothetical protein